MVTLDIETEPKPELIFAARGIHLGHYWCLLPLITVKYHNQMILYLPTLTIVCSLVDRICMVRLEINQKFY
jgi:hypothetical protein